jgi:hypothetical protein
MNGQDWQTKSCLLASRNSSRTCRSTKRQTSRRGWFGLNILAGRKAAAPKADMAKQSIVA